MSETPGSVPPPLPNSEEAVAVARIRKWNRVYKVAVIWLIVCVGLIVEKIVNLGSVEDGLRAGFMASAFTAPFFTVIAVVLGFVGSQLGSQPGWQRYRLLMTFALPTLLMLVLVGACLYDRTFPEKKFQRITGVEFPRDARMERYVLDTGWSPVHDTTCTFEITCPAEQMSQLLDAMKMRKQSIPPGMASPYGAPSTGWIVTEEWMQHQDPSKDTIPTEFISADTDASHTKLRVIWSTI